MDTFISGERSYYYDKIKWREPDTLPTPDRTGKVAKSRVCLRLRTERNNPWRRIGEGKAEG